MEKNVDEFAEIIGQVLTHTVNEPYVLNKLEKYFDPKPAQLAKSEESSKKIEKRLQVLSEQLGGPPSLSALQEVLRVSLGVSEEKLGFVSEIYFVILLVTISHPLAEFDFITLGIPTFTFQFHFNFHSHFLNKFIPLKGFPSSFSS